jgi:hypothetical protein
VQPNEHFLNDVIRIVGVTGKTECPSVDLAVVLSHEGFEGGPVALLCPPDQILTRFIRPAIFLQRLSEVLSLVPGDEMPLVPFPFTPPLPDLLPNHYLHPSSESPQTARPN